MEKENYSIQDCLKKAKEKFREISEKNIAMNFGNPEYKKINDSIKACFLRISNCYTTDDIDTPEEIIAGYIIFSDKIFFGLSKKERKQLRVSFGFKKDGLAHLVPDDEDFPNLILKVPSFAPWDVILDEIIDLSKKYMKIDEPSSIIIEKY